MPHESVCFVKLSVGFLLVYLVEHVDIVTSRDKPEVK